MSAGNDLADPTDFSSSLKIGKNIANRYTPEILLHFVFVWQVIVTAKFRKIIASQEKSFPFRVFINLSSRFIRKNELEICLLFSIRRCTQTGHTVFWTCFGNQKPHPRFWHYQRSLLCQSQSNTGFQFSCVLRGWHCK